MVITLFPKGQKTHSYILEVSQNTLEWSFTQKSSHRKNYVGLSQTIFVSSNKAALRIVLESALIYILRWKQNVEFRMSHKLKILSLYQVHSGLKMPVEHWLKPAHNTMINISLSNTEQSGFVCCSQPKDFQPNHIMVNWSHPLQASLSASKSQSDLSSHTTFPQNAQQQEHCINILKGSLGNLLFRTSCKPAY